MTRLNPSLPLVACLFAALSAGVANAASATHPNDVVSVVVENHGAAESNVLATFGQAFARGDVPKGSTLSAEADGQSIPLQVDAKATHADGSLRHAVLTVQIPHLSSGGHARIMLQRNGAASGPASSTSLALPPDFDAVVTLKLKDKTLTASAKTLLASQTPATWLSGALVSERWVTGPFRDGKGAADPHLHVQFGIRSYGKSGPVRIEADVENDWSYVPGPKTEFYDAKIEAHGRTVYAHAGMVQPSHTRWRFGFWWQEPVSTYVRQNLAYLEKAHVVPNYDPAVDIPGAALSELFDKFDAAPRGPMTSGIIEKYMPETGGRWDIGPLPHWQALYLLTMDPHAYAIMLQTADDGASFSSHYRNEKTHLPVTLDDYPLFSTHSNLVGRGPGQLQLPDTGGYTDPLVPDAAHEPSLDFVPYLVTGDRFYLEELQFWAEWNLTGTAPMYRGAGQGLVKFDQIRAQAWSLRTLAQAAYITPNGSPLKNTFLRQLKTNIAWYENTYIKNPANRLHIIDQADSPYDSGRGIAPWQDDFFMWSIGYIGGLGDVDTLPLVRWKGAFSVGRMTAPGFCWVLAPAYTLRVRASAQAAYYQTLAEVYDASLPAQIKHPAEVSRRPPCASSEMAAALGLDNAGEMVAEPTSADGYSAYMQPALAAAVDAGVPGAADAWRLFRNRPIKPDFSAYPDWAIVPRSEAQGNSP